MVHCIPTSGRASPPTTSAEVLSELRVLTKTMFKASNVNDTLFLFVRAVRSESKFQSG